MKKNGAGSKTKQAAAPAPRRLSRLRFYSGGFVLDTASGSFWRLTPAADYLLRQYDAGTEVRDFPGLIETRYGQDHASAVRDVELLLNRFSAPGFLRHAATRPAE